MSNHETTQDAAYYIRDKGREGYDVYFVGPYAKREHAELDIRGRTDPENVSIVRAQLIDPALTMLRFFDFDDFIDQFEQWLVDHQGRDEFADWEDEIVWTREPGAAHALEKVLMEWAREYLIVDVKRVVNEP